MKMKCHLTTLKLLISITSLGVALCADAEDRLRPFKSDGCSAFPDGTFEQKTLWLNCCSAHDYQYWKGGTQQQRVDSDKALKVCVEQVGEPKTALLMLTGVRFWGTPYLPTAFRWGYGWSFPRFYGALTAEELMQVESFSN